MPYDLQKRGERSMKVTINLSEQALKLADECAERLCISRSAFIAIAIAEKAKQDSVAEHLPQILAEMKQLRELAAYSPDAVERHAVADRSGLGASQTAGKPEN